MMVWWTGLAMVTGLAVLAVVDVRRICRTVYR